jgi:hypothetical protein
LGDTVAAATPIERRRWDGVVEKLIVLSHRFGEPPDEIALDACGELRMAVVEGTVDRRGISVDRGISG